MQVWRTAEVVSSASPAPAMHFAAHDGAVTELAYHSSGRCAVQRADASLQSSRAHAPAVTSWCVLSVHIESPAQSSAVQLSAHQSLLCRWLLSSALCGTLRLWDLQAGSLHYTLHGHEGAVLACAFTPSGMHAC